MDISDHTISSRPETWNLSPSSSALAVRNLEGSLETFWPTWGLELRGSIKPNNIRLETYLEKAFFAQCPRCLVPVDGWYEWKSIGSGKQPYYFKRRDDQPLLLAGLYLKNTFSLLTKPAQGHLIHVHYRQPLALPVDHALSWLREPTLHSEGILPDTIEYYPVSARVNSSRCDGPDLLNRVQLPKTPGQSELF